MGPIIVYWTSKYIGTNKGWDTPLYKANMMSFNDIEKAITFRDKLVQLMEQGGSYRGRLVYHVGELK